MVVFLFALSFELGRDGSQHRIRGLFERALSNDRLQRSVLLWRCYLAYEAQTARSPNAARRVFYRSIHACPWYVPPASSPPSSPYPSPSTEEEEEAGGERVEREREGKPRVRSGPHQSLEPAQMGNGPEWER